MTTICPPRRLNCSSGGEGNSFEIVLPRVDEPLEVPARDGRRHSAGRVDAVQTSWPAPQLG